MVDDLAALVACESPSDDLPAIAACGELVVDLGNDLFGMTAEGRDSEGPLLLWRGGGPTSVLLVGHLGTAWPVGTVARRPFSVDGDRASGPGVFDMKAGLVQMLYALVGARRPDRRDDGGHADPDARLGRFSRRAGTGGPGGAGGADRRSG